MSLAYGATSFINNIVLNQCSRPIHIYIETAIPCLIKAIITVNVPLPDDILRDHARQQAGLPHLRTGRRVRHGSRWIWKDGIEPDKKRHYRGVAHVLKWTAPLEFIGYNMLIWGAANRFFYDWQALINGVTFCNDRTLGGPFQRSITDAQAFPNAILLPDLDQNRDGWGSDPTTVIVPPGDYSVTFSFSFHYDGDSPGEWFTRITAPFGAFPTTYTGGRVGAGGEGDYQSVFHCEFRAPVGGPIQWGLFGDPVPVGFTECSGEVTVIGLKQ